MKKQLIGLLLGIALLILGFVLLTLTGCAAEETPENPMVAATTYPVYQFTEAICDGTGIQVEHSFFDLRYPFWHDHGLTIRDCELTDK